MLDSLKAALDTTGYKFAHYGWTKNAEALKGDFGVYAEDGSEDFVANDVHLEGGMTGFIDYFTRDDSGTPKETIEAALNALPIFCWRLNTIQFEETSGYIHYEWIWGMYGKEIVEEEP